MGEQHGYQLDLADVNGPVYRASCSCGWLCPTRPQALVDRADAGRRPRAGPQLPGDPPAPQPPHQQHEPPARQPPTRQSPAPVLYASGRRAFQSAAVDMLTLLDLDPRRPCWTGTWHCQTWPTPPTPWPPSSTTATRSSVASASYSPATYPQTKAGTNSPGVPPPTGTISLQPPVSSCAHSPHPPPATPLGTTAATRDDRPRQPVRSTRPPTARVRPAAPPISPGSAQRQRPPCRTPHP